MTMQEIRYSRLYAKMEEKGLDAVYVRSAENHLYMSHFDNPDGNLFLTRTDGWVFADFRYTEAAKEASFPCLHVCEPGKPKLEELVVSENCKRVGYEDGSLTCAALAVPLAMAGAFAGAAAGALASTFTVRAFASSAAISSPAS